jgi:hypothetical protein
MKNWINAYPHPGPLPQERERDFAPTLFDVPLRVRFFWSVASVHLNKAAFGDAQCGGSFLPLLGERAGVRADQSSKDTRRNSIHPLAFA